MVGGVISSAECANSALYHKEIDGLRRDTGKVGYGLEDVTIKLSVGGGGPYP